MKVLLALQIALVFVLVGCQGESESDRIQREKQEVMSVQSNAQVGMPGITNFTEKKLMRQLYEIRDQAKLLTYTYVTDMQGRLWHVCDSVGYGLPYGTQFSNPSKMSYGPNSSGGNVVVIPQSEPNGLFMPPSAEGTWVQCIGSGGKIAPMYVEQRIISSPWKLKAFGSYAPDPAEK